MLRLRSQRLIVNAQRHGRRARTLSRTKHIMSRARHYRATKFELAVPDNVVNEIDQHRVLAAF